jgi:hypothetical protein
MKWFALINCNILTIAEKDNAELARHPYGK